MALKYTLKDGTSHGMCLLEAKKLDHSCKTLWHLESLAEPVQVVCMPDFKWWYLFAGHFCRVCILWPLLPVETFSCILSTS